jgi:TIR domain-containing protein
VAQGEAWTDGATAFAASARFRAFVSYCHADAAFARRLQRRLETYRVPRRLADRIPPIGAAQGRVGPVFRDREDLPASADLSEAVKDGLARSQALIVVCSPAAARSPWVAREIELFRALHPDRPVLAALLRGTPEAAFPAEIGKDGAEPLAADFRRAGDGRKLAFLKVVAGILGIPLDELIQRDGQRRHRRVMAVTAAAVAAMLVLAAMTVLAIGARRDAERQRGEAEGLVEYMLTDVRPSLKAVGRLDVQHKLNQRAMRYYEGQGRLEALSDDSLERRARVIGAMGEDYENNGYYDRAHAHYAALYRTTQALLAKDPGNPSRVLAHARSENRLALLAITRAQLAETERQRRGPQAASLATIREQLAEASRRLRGTRSLLGSIAGWGQKQGEWLRLSAYAEGNSCATMLRRGEDKAAALDHCRRAVFYNERLAALHSEDDSASYDLVFHLSWLAEAQHAAGQDAPARSTQARYLGLMDKLIARDPENMLWREQQMELYVRHAKFLRAQGEREAARKYLVEARAISRRLAARDPQNAVWADYRKRLAEPSAGSD